MQIFFLRIYWQFCDAVAAFRLGFICNKDKKQPIALLQWAVQTVKEPREGSEGRTPPIFDPFLATCAAETEPLRSKGFLSPFAARGAVGS